MKPAMGIFSIQSKITGKYYLEGTLNLKSSINRALFQLNWGSHPNRELQRDWNEWGEDNFVASIVDELPYTKDQGRQNYHDEVAQLRAMWQEKLGLEGASFY